jgi:hypothetical protein
MRHLVLCPSLIVPAQGFIDTQSCYPNGNPLVCPAMKGSGVDLYQYSESLLRASRAQSGMRWAVEAAFSRARLDRWMHCPVRRAILHHAESMIMTSLLNTLWFLPFVKPADWAEADERTQRRYTKGTEYSCATILFDYFCDKFASR